MADNISDPPIRQKVINPLTGMFERPWLTWLRDLYVRVTRYLDNNFVQVGYGGIGLTVPQTVGTGTLTDLAWVTLEGWNEVLTNNPKNTTQDIANNAVGCNLEGVWRFDAKVSLEFDELNAGRRIKMRSYNFTQGVGGTVEFTFGVGRNVGVANLTVPINVDIDNVPAKPGDLMQLQIKAGTGSADFTNLVNIGSIFQTTHVSEKKA